MVIIFLDRMVFRIFTGKQFGVGYAGSRTRSSKVTRISKR